MNPIPSAKEFNLLPYILSQVQKGDPQSPEVQSARKLLETSWKIGISLTLDDSNLYAASWKFTNLTDLLLSPEFISALKQTFYICDTNEALWWSLSIRNGKIQGVRYLLTIHILAVHILNLDSGKFDAIVVIYKASNTASGNSFAILSSDDYSPRRIVKHFPLVASQTANNELEIGKVLCYLIAKHIRKPAADMLHFCGEKQGFEQNRCTHHYQFNPPPLLNNRFSPFLSPSVLSRQYPPYSDFLHQDLTPILHPLFAQKSSLQIALLFRIASLCLFLFRRWGITADNIVLVKPTASITASMLVTLFNNICYRSPNAAPIGPNIKPLRFQLDSVNDGIVVVLNNYSADQLKKSEHGYDLLINDVTRASESSSSINHICVLISAADEFYIPYDKRCSLELNEVPVTAIDEYQVALGRLDANLIQRIENGSNNENLIERFKVHIQNVRNAMPSNIPVSKRNTFILLQTALTLFNEWYTPLFSPDIRQYIEEWLVNQEDEHYSLSDSISAEYSSIFNRQISNGQLSLVLKEDVTPFEKGSHTVIVDTKHKRVFVEPADSFAIAQEMTLVSDTDKLTSALYDCGYLPHNGKAEKSVRVATEAMDGTMHSIYFHAISFDLLTFENRKKLELIKMEPYLFCRDEMPDEKFLPLIKTIDGRFAGKMLSFEAAASNSYLGTGRSGSGKSWAIAQLMPMLLMIGQNVIVLDTSGSYTESQLRRMLPDDVVSELFRFINIGLHQDKIPVNLGSLKGCNNLADRKRRIYDVLAATVGKFDKDKSKDRTKRTVLKELLSTYLKHKSDTVDFLDLIRFLKSDKRYELQITDQLFTVFQEIAEIGSEAGDWDEVFERPKIVVVNCGIEVGDTSHILLDLLVASLLDWQMLHDEKGLAIVIDELADQNFATNSPLNTIVRQGRKFHTALVGATQDYFNQSNTSLDVMKQAAIKSYGRPGKSEDRVAQQLGFANAIDAGFHDFKAGDAIMTFDAYNKESGINEPIVLRGRVVDYADTPFYGIFKQTYTNNPRKHSERYGNVY